MTKAGPKALAGLMHMLLMGPTSHMSSRMASGTEIGPSLGPQPLQKTMASWQGVGRLHSSAAQQSPVYKLSSVELLVLGLSSTE